MKYIQYFFAAALCLLATGAIYAQDLVPQNVSVSNAYSGIPNSSIPESGNFTIRVDVKNNASSGTAGASTVRYYISRKSFYDNTATYLGQDAVSSLAPGTDNDESLSATLPSGIDPRDGGYYILVRVDALNNVSETNEGNNVVAVPVNVINGAADLFPYAESAPASTNAGRTINVSVRVGNQGSFGSVPSVLKVYLSTNNTLGGDVLAGQANVSNIASGVGSNRLVSLSITLPLGSEVYNYLIFQVDANSQIFELDENNNTRAEAINIAPPIGDLVVEQGNAPNNVVLNDNTSTSINVSATVRNIGSGTSGVSVLNYWLSSNQVLDNNDRLLGSSNIRSLLVNDADPDTRTVNIPSSVAPGSYYILYEADANNQVSEEDESNNLASRTVILEEAFKDLTVISMNVIGTFSANGVPSAYEGEDFKVDLTYRNDGNTSSGGFVIAYYLSADNKLDPLEDEFITQKIASSVSANTSKNKDNVTVSVPSSIVSSDSFYNIIVKVDDANEVTESQEGNNIRTFSARIYNQTSGRPGGGFTPPCCITPPGGGGLGFVRQTGPGLEQAGAFELSTYPNPAKGSTTVSLGAVGNYNVQLVDAQGRQVLQRQVQNTNSTSLDLAGLQKGIYLIKAQGAAGVKTQRLVVQ